MPSTTPDFSTVTAGCSSFRAGGAVGLAEGRGCPRRLRRCGGTSPGLGRSGFGQASSNDAGGGSAGSAAAARRAGWGEGPPTADPAATVRWCAPAPARALSATSRKTADCASASPRPRPVGRRSARAAKRARRPHPARRRRRRRGSCGGLGAGGTLGGLRVAVNGKPPSPAGGSREMPGGSTGRTVTSPRGCGTPAPSRRAMFFSSRTAIQSPSMIAPVQTPITPVRISVLPRTEFLDRDSDSRSPAGPPKQGQYRQPTCQPSSN